jgi:hypothetical protein
MIWRRYGASPRRIRLRAPLTALAAAVGVGIAPKFAPAAAALARLRQLAAAPHLRAARDLGLFPTADQLDQVCFVCFML